MDPLPEKDIPTRALVVEKTFAPFELRDVILDEVRSNEVLVQLRYTGICHTVKTTVLASGETGLWLTMSCRIL
jgi:Zn-dependent alcohol dehydrogenase